MAEDLSMRDIVLIEDEEEDQRLIKEYIQRDILGPRPGFCLRVYRTMEEAIENLAARWRDALAPPALLVVDLYLYSEALGDAPATLLSQLFLEFFIVRGSLLREQLEADSASLSADPVKLPAVLTEGSEEPRRVVMGRLGLLSLLVDEILRFPESERPKLLIMSQVFDYSRRYNRPFAYDVRRALRAASIKKATIHARPSSRHFAEAPAVGLLDTNTRHVLRVMGDTVSRYIEDLQSRCASRDGDRQIYIFEKPYNYSIGMTPPEAKARTVRVLPKLKELFDKDLLPAIGP